MQKIKRLLFLLILAVPAWAAQYTVEPGTYYILTACIRDLAGNPVPSGILIAWSTAPGQKGSGFHPHEIGDLFDQRPQVSILKATTYTGTNGCTQTEVVYPWYAGSYPVSACSPYASNVCFTDIYNVMSPFQIIQMGAGGLGFAFRSDYWHGNLDRGLSFYEGYLLTYIGARYWLLLNQSFTVNRASLPWGGYSDNNTVWFAAYNPDAHQNGFNWDIQIPASITNQHILLGIINSSPDLYGGWCRVVNFGTYWDVSCE